jgi:hypothetical protein
MPISAYKCSTPSAACLLTITLCAVQSRQSQVSVQVFIFLQGGMRLLTCTFLHLKFLARAVIQRWQASDVGLPVFYVCLKCILV